MPRFPLRLRRPVGNSLTNDPDDITDLALSLEGSGGPPPSDAAKLGIWDQATRNAIIDFQKWHALKIDGGLLPGGQTEQMINKLLANRPDRNGSSEPTTRQDRHLPSDHRRGAHRAKDSLTPAGAIADLKVPPDTLIQSPDSFLPGVADAAIPSPRPSQFAGTRARQNFKRGNVVPVTDETGSKQTAPRNTLSNLSGWIMAQPPFGLSPSAVQAAKRIYNWSNEPALGLSKLKRKSLSNVDAAIAGMSKPGNHSLLARISNAIAAGRLRQARAYTDAFMPTTKGELAMSGISVVGSVAAAGKTLMVLRRGNKVFLESTLAQELKLLPHKKTPTHQHHPLPRFGKSDENKIFRNFFTDRGIDIHQIIVHVPAETHLKWLHGGGDRWLIDWKVWIRNNPHATASQVYRFAGEMNYKYGLDGMEFGPYRRSRVRKRVQKSRVFRKPK